MVYGSEIRIVDSDDGEALIDEARSEGWTIYHCWMFVRQEDRGIAAPTRTVMHHRVQWSDDSMEHEIVGDRAAELTEALVVWFRVNHHLGAHAHVLREPDETTTI